MDTWYYKLLEKYSSASGVDEASIRSLKTMLKSFSPEDPEVSVVIPAWNEEKNIMPTLASLASTKTHLKTEIIVVNNNSTDGTQALLDRLAVRSFFQPEQGIAYARQLGLEKARGIYHLCADSDTLYPPNWIDAMVKPMKQDNNVVGVYGRYSFIPSVGGSRQSYRIYEFLTGILVRWRRLRKKEFINVLGFNMGFVKAIADGTEGFRVTRARKFDNAYGSADHVHESEDGRMAVRLMEKGELRLVARSEGRVFTSARRLDAEGGIVRAALRRISSSLNMG